uniref:RRM domain-containing protein n=1 Tax=Oryza brachyantha TaxID=4533 RepID=J3LQ77_ORYBR
MRVMNFRVRDRLRTGLRWSYLFLKYQRTDKSTLTQASSHQIYLTFPAESTFTEDDVTNYFGQYGPVRDVRN